MARLDLKKFNCEYFTITSRFTASSEGDIRIQKWMEELPFVRQDDDGHMSATFGTKSQIKGNRYQVLGTFSTHPSVPDSEYNCSVTYLSAPDDLTRPPRELKPVSHLEEAASELFGEISLDCVAMLTYDTSDGWRSKVHLPYAWPIQDIDSGVTHVESITLSRREEDKVQWSIDVSYSDDDRSVIRHIVRYKITRVLSSRAMRELLIQTRNISLKLLTKNQGS